MSSPCSCSCGLGSPPDSEPGPIHRAEPWPLALLRLIRPLRRRLLLGHRQVRDSGWVAGGLPDRLSGRDVNHRPWHRGRATRPPRGQSPPHRRNQARLSRSNALSPDTTAVEGSETLEEWSVVQVNLLERQDRCGGDSRTSQVDRSGDAQGPTEPPVSGVMAERGGCRLSSSHKIVSAEITAGGLRCVALTSMLSGS